VELLSTLRVFIDADGHLQATADRLYVHVNTVRHRLRRIRELSGRDPLSQNDLVDLRIALWTAERRKAVEHRLIRPFHR
jgi:DNA-binding PucR family transcriptional regulator